LDGYGGSLILVRNSISSSKVSLESSLHLFNNTSSTIATARLQFHNHSLTIASIYIPPTANIDYQAFKTLLDPHLHIDILAGDFNAKSPLWGNSQYNARGEILEEAIADSHAFSVINTGDHTFIGPQSSSALDITICKHHIAWKSSWQIIPDLSGSNHVPILISIQDVNSTPNISHSNQTHSNHFQQININKINWSSFSSISAQQISDISDIDNSPQQAYQTFKNILMNATVQSATSKSYFTNAHSNRKQAPIWWSHECDLAVQQRKIAFRRFTAHPCSENFILVRKMNAQAKRTFKQARKLSCTKLN